MPDEQETGTTQAEEVAAGGGPATNYSVTERRLNLRTLASTDAEVIKVLNSGDEITGRDTGDGWIEVEEGGYVRAEFVKAAPRRRRKGRR